MASTKEKAQGVKWFAESKSEITVQRQFRYVFHKDPPDLKLSDDGSEHFWLLVVCKSGKEKVGEYLKSE
ncbi:hypothetical protein ANN_19186 [Periplaneta americana]|uniref:DUF4817 domain-containing protein n=1 Tax=Periplaneta americana TaxID=6978 RepID=A0ABQ8S9J2_PERAM|nr:hypothetical protein ANN_19186 [Periplaneta americana]